jgi:alkanesulfonate monooxygenase
MSEYHWCLPMFDDPSPEPGSVRPPQIDHLTQIGDAAEAGGFTALLLGTGWGQKVEAFTTAAALLQRCHRIRALIAVRPGYYHPCAVAKLAATIDQHTHGRVLLNVVTGGVPSDLARYGDTLEHDARYARTREFLHIFTTLTQHPDTPLTYHGEFFSCSEAILDYGLAGDPTPRIYFGGASEPAQQIAGTYADTYLMWGIPLDEARTTVTRIRQHATDHGRTIRCGMRINIIARPDTDQAWTVAHRLLQDATPATLNRVRSVAAETDSVGQQQMFALAGRAPTLTTRPTTTGPASTYWTGLARLRVGSGTALVGSYEDVAAALRQYADAGIDTFILAGTPHLEECQRVGQYVLPLLGES